MFVLNVLRIIYTQKEKYYVYVITSPVFQQVSQQSNVQRCFIYAPSWVLNKRTSSVSSQRATDFSCRLSEDFKSLDRYLFSLVLDSSFSQRHRPQQPRSHWRWNWPRNGRKIIFFSDDVNPSYMCFFVARFCFFSSPLFIYIFRNIFTSRQNIFFYVLAHLSCFFSGHFSCVCGWRFPDVDLRIL